MSDEWSHNKCTWHWTLVPQVQEQVQVQLQVQVQVRLYMYRNDVTRQRVPRVCRLCSNSVSPNFCGGEKRRKQCSMLVRCGVRKSVYVATVLETVLRHARSRVDLARSRAACTPRRDGGAHTGWRRSHGIGRRRRHRHVGREVRRLRAPCGRAEANGVVPAAAVVLGARRRRGARCRIHQWCWRRWRGLR